MSNTNRLAIVFATGAAVVALCLALSLASPRPAHAGTSAYCNGYNAPAYLVSGYMCQGAQRTLYAVYGWGDQHAVCIGVTQGYNVTCSHGPGEGTYDPLGVTGSFIPWIDNRGGSPNTLHGVAYQP
jgi:hypothetical protein